MTLIDAGFVVPCYSHHGNTGCHSICVLTSTTIHLLISYGASAVDYFIPFLYRLQRGVGLTQKVDYPIYGLMRAQTFDNMVSGKFP